MSNSIELLEDDAPDMREEVARLLAMSSEQASHRRQFFRIAFGRSKSASIAPAAAARAQVNDPRLAEVFDEIDLRVRVELAECADKA